MTDAIAPALTEREWAKLGPEGVGHPIIPSTIPDIEHLDDDDKVKALAVANHALPDSSPHKITRARLGAARRAIAGKVDLSDDEWRSDDEGELEALFLQLDAILRPTE